MRQLILLSLFALPLAACSTLGTHPPRNTDISGDWQLNESLSDDPMAVMRQHMPQGGGGGMRHHGGMGGGMGGMGMPPSGGGGGGMGRHGGGSGGYGGGGRGAGHGSGRGPSNDFIERAEHLTIQQAPDKLKLTADSVPTEYEYGEKVMASVRNGAAERSSGWKGQAFVVKYDVKDGPKATRSYELNDGGSQLVVTTEVSGGPGGTLKLHSVYERKPGGKAS